MRRIDLVGVDEIASGEMKIVVVDGTDQVLVIRQGDEFTATQPMPLRLRRSTLAVRAW